MAEENKQNRSSEKFEDMVIPTWPPAKDSLALLICEFPMSTTEELEGFLKMARASDEFDEHSAQWK